MKKLFITIVFVVMSVLFVAPINVEAISVSDITTNNIYVLDNTTTPEVVEDIDNCDGTNSILGDPTKEDSVAWLINEIMNYIKVLGPILVVVLSSVDFIKVIIKSDDEAMAKAQKKLILRLILALLLFLIPTIVNAILGIFGMSDGAVCGV